MFAKYKRDPDQIHAAVLGKRCIDVRQRRVDTENRNSERGYDDDEHQQQKPVNNLGHQFPLVFDLGTASAVNVFDPV